MTHLRAADIHRMVDWPTVLPRLGIEVALEKPNRPCPACGGTDRFTFDNRKGRGDFYCRVCGAGDGFELLRRVYSWDFREARRQVIEAARLSTSDAALTPMRTIAPPTTLHEVLASPTKRVRNILTSSCALVDCTDAVTYLDSRRLWPLPRTTTLRAHVGIDYFDQGHQRVSKYAALLAPLTDIDGELVTLRVTYLDGGQKAPVDNPRKFLSKLTGRRGCAVRLMPAGELLGIAEGIETALSATAIDGVPVWAATTAVLLAKFEPPAGVTTLRIYADNDVPGLLAACQLMERLQGRFRLEVQVPKASHKDFNDQLVATTATRRTT
jgi:putative DNA primase/helicase